MVEYYPPLLRQYLGEERDSRKKFVDATTRQATFIAAASQGTSAAAQGPEPVSRKERAHFNQLIRPLEEASLTTFARQQKLWVAEQDFLKEYGQRKIGAGAEQQVYLGKDGRTVIKVNTGSFHGTWLEYFNRLIYHSFLFPSTKYATVGFTTADGTFAAITTQEFAILERGAPREKVEAYLGEHGFIRTRNDDYYNQDLGIILEDLHDQNVFMSEKGALLFIDPVIYIETIDMGLKGECLFRFPFQKQN